MEAHEAERKNLKKSKLNKIWGGNTIWLMQKESLKNAAASGAQRQ
jgi:hypothetical protein